MSDDRKLVPLNVPRLLDVPCGPKLAVPGTSGKVSVPNVPKLPVNTPFCGAPEGNVSVPPEYGMSPFGVCWIKPWAVPLPLVFLSRPA